MINQYTFAASLVLITGNKDGSDLIKLYSREPSGTEMRVTSVDHDWVYFEVISEDGISVNRIKKDGSRFEHIEQKSVSD